MKVTSFNFDILEEALRENHMLDKQCHIFNLDKTSVPLDPKPLKIVAAWREKSQALLEVGRRSR